MSRYSDLVRIPTNSDTRTWLIRETNAPGLLKVRFTVDVNGRKTSGYLINCKSNTDGVEGVIEHDDFAVHQSLTMYPDEWRLRVDTTIRETWPNASHLNLTLLPEPAVPFPPEWPGGRYNVRIRQPYLGSPSPVTTKMARKWIGLRVPLWVRNQRWSTAQIKAAEVDSTGYIALVVDVDVGGMSGQSWQGAFWKDNDNWVLSGITVTNELRAGDVPQEEENVLGRQDIRATETCSCGASYTYEPTYTTRENIEWWRRNHRHEFPPVNK